MAHFFKPQDEAPAGYTVDRRLAPDSVGIVEVQVGAAKRVGLWGGKGLWVRSQHPDIVANPILVRPLSGDTDVITLEGRKEGTATIETGVGNNRSVTLTVKVIADQTTTLLPQEMASRPFPPDFLQQASATFSVGFAEGLTKKLDKGLAKALSDKILANKLDFYIGYVSGLLKGLLGGLIALLKLLYDVVKLADSVSMPKLMFSLAKEAYLNITNSAHREMRALQIENARKVANLVAGLVQEIHAKPMLYISKSRTSGVILGAELAAYVNTEAHQRSASSLGSFFGEIIGRVLFEIIIFIVMAAISGGAGEAGRAGLALGEAAEGSKTYAGLLKKLMEVLEEMPAIRKLIAELFEAKGLTTAAKAGEAVEGVEVFRIAREAVIRAPGASAAEKALALERVFAEIPKTGASWSAKRSAAVGCEALFTGEAAPWGLIVDSKGVVWQAKEIQNAGTYVLEGGKLIYAPDFARWVQVVPK